MPGWLQAWLTGLPVPVFPSPKSQAKLVACVVVAVRLTLASVAALHWLMPN